MISSQNKKVKYFLVASVTVFLVYVLYDSFSQPNTNDLKGNFKEISIYRNPNNTGPIIRIYAVSVQGTPWDEMQKYGELMPYTKYGTTTVYFFPQGKPAPKSLFPGNTNFQSKFNEHCLAKYSKDANGQISFTKNPFI